MRPNPFACASASAFSNETPLLVICDKIQLQVPFKMPEMEYGKPVKYKDITDMEGYHENSEDKQNRHSDARQDVKSDKK